MMLSTVIVDSLQLKFFGHSTINGLLWIVIVLSIAWKRRMTQGGSWLAKNLKELALNARRRRNKRLKDFLTDDLLRPQMQKEFDEKMGKEECARHIQELELTASREVTADDVHVSTNEVVGAAMRWICLVYSIIAVLMLVVLSQDEALCQLSVALALHTVDNNNKFNVAKRKAKWMEWTWQAVWAALQILVSSLQALELEIPQSFLMVGFLVALVFAVASSSSGGKMDSVCGSRPSQDQSIMEV
jgi:hypothetical protein